MRNFKRILTAVILLLFFACNIGLSWLLYPYTYTRANFHAMKEGSYEGLIVGGSHAKCGIDPEVLYTMTGKKYLNSAQGGEHSLDILYLVKEAASRTDLKTVIYEIDPAYWVDKPNQSQEYVALYHEYPQSVRKVPYALDKMLVADLRTSLFEWYLYRKEIFHIKDRIAEKSSEEYKNFSLASFSDEIQTYREDGFIARHRTEDGTDYETEPSLWNEKTYNTDEQKYFEELVSFCRENSIELITVMMPVPDTSYETYTDSYASAQDFFTDYLKSQDVLFLDCLHSDLAEMPRDLQDFCDNDGHLFEDSAVRFTGILAKAIS